MGHIGLIVITRGCLLEGHGADQNRLTPLQGHHPPRAETEAIAGPFHFLVDRPGGIAWTQEVGVLRVDVSIGGHGGHGHTDSLCQHLSTVYAVGCLRMHIVAPEAVLPYSLGRHNMEQLLEHHNTLFTLEAPLSRFLNPCQTNCEGRVRNNLAAGCLYLIFSGDTSVTTDKEHR